MRENASDEAATDDATEALYQLVRTWLIIVLAIELLLAVSAASHGHVNQKGLRKASREYHDNPNETTMAELNRQLRINLTTRVGLGATFFACMAGVTCAVVFGVGYFQSRRREKLVSKVR